MDKAKWKEEIAALVNAKQYVSFAEIEAAWPDLSKGQSILHVPGKDNLIVWQGLSAPVAEAITEMVAEGSLHLHPTTILVYLADRKMLDMPVAQTMDVPPQASMCWLPVTLCTFKNDRDSELEAIRDRLSELSDWTNGRSSHTFPSDAAHASALARTYVKDMRFMFGVLRHLQERLEEANGGKPRSKTGPGGPPRPEAQEG